MHFLESGACSTNMGVWETAVAKTETTGSVTVTLANGLAVSGGSAGRRAPHGGGKRTSAEDDRKRLKAMLLAAAAAAEVRGTEGGVGEKGQVRSTSSARVMSPSGALAGRRRMREQAGSAESWSRSAQRKQSAWSGSRPAQRMS